MEAAVAEGVSADRTAESTPTTPLQTTRKCQKRKRRFSGGPWEGRHGRGGRRTPHKKAKLQVSSTHTANNIMRFRLGGSVSDPLNLAGGDDVADNCSTCAPSPVTPTCDDLELPDLPPQLMKDPLNLEGKVKNFPLSGTTCELELTSRLLFFFKSATTMLKPDYNYILTGPL